MSFWPLAKTLTDRLRSASTLGALLELGCGGGAFVERLEAARLPVIALDHDLRSLRSFSTTAPVSPRVCARAEALPVRDGSVGAVLCANLLRSAKGSWEAIGRSCRRALAPGGILLILEDDAEDDARAAAHYREALRLLALADPTRGPAMSGREVESICRPLFGAPIEAGSEVNELRVSDPEIPLHWLAARDLDAEARRDLERLREDVRRDGMNYGRYLYRVFRVEHACAG